MVKKIIVKVNEGRIQGVEELSIHSKTSYYAFYGIPYAEPPVKNLRFKDPVKVKKWTDIHDGTNDKQGCIQLKVLEDCEFWGTEDCLFNNIFTSRLPNEGEILRPVIVSIHGGAFFTGSAHSKQYGSPNFIMQHDVVYVCISYRLHILGFLNLELEECSGNQAIKDIIMALRWIKDNVACFGGDAENITLLGCSSGASIIHSLMLSPAVEKDLFHKAVFMSGYLMNPTTPHTATNKHHAREIAKSLGYTGDLDDYVKILKFFKKKPAIDLLTCLLIYEKNLPKKVAPVTAIGIFSPTMDSVIIPCSPIKLAPSIKRIPIMVGYCERDSVNGFSRILKKETEDNFYTSFCQNCWGWGHHLEKNEIDSIKKQMQSFYAIERPIPLTPLSVKVDIQTDIGISDLYDTLVNPISIHLPRSVFVYKFEFEGNLPNLKTSGIFAEIVDGTYHSTDFIYWSSFTSNSNDPNTRFVIDSVTKLITTFAKKGDPNYEELQVKWKPSTLEKPCYFSINIPMQMVEGRLNEKRLKFWDGVKKQFRQD